MLEGAWIIRSAYDDPDLPLVRALAQGDKRALDDLYARHGLALLAYLIGQLGGDRLLAEEVLQDVMLAVWQGAPRFRGESRVQTWMLAIARRRAINARQRRPPEHVPLDDGTPEAAAGPPEVIEWQDQQAALRAALEQLPADQRETLELFFYHQLSGPEVAAVLGVPPGTVKSRLHRAKAMLAQLLRLQER